MSIFNAAARRSVGLEVRAEDILDIERHPPFELSQIKPGQVVFYVSHDEGVDKNSFAKISEAFAYLSEVNNWDINWSIITTDNGDLIDLFAGRPEKEVNIPYKVVVGYWESIAGFASQFFDKDIETIKDSVPEKEYRHISITEKKPIVVSIDPNNCPAKTRQGDDDDDSLELLTVEPKTEKEVNKFIAQKEKALEKVLRECVIFNIDLDVDKVRKRIEDSLKSNVDYKLVLDIAAPVSFITKCNIYVADGEDYKLELTGVEKATYLTFMLYDEGISVLNASSDKDFRSNTQKIYDKLPGKDKCEKNKGGIMDKDNVLDDDYADTLRGYISTIREKIAHKIPHPLTAQQFAIEGYKGNKYRIQQSTPELRAQIIDYFDL